jgi:hypothetical protein
VTRQDKIDQEVWDTAHAHYSRLNMGPGCSGSERLRDALNSIIPIIDRKARVDELTGWLSRLPEESGELEANLIRRLEELGYHGD